MSSDFAAQVCITPEQVALLCDSALSKQERAMADNTEGSLLRNDEQMQTN